MLHFSDDWLTQLGRARLFFVWVYKSQVWNFQLEYIPYIVRVGIYCDLLSSVQLVSVLLLIYYYIQLKNPNCAFMALVHNNQTDSDYNHKIVSLSQNFMIN